MRSPGDQHTPEFLAGHTPVAAAAALLPAEPLLVSADTSIAQLAERLSQHGNVRTILVVDADRRLLGIIPLTRLVDDLFLRVAPEAFLRHALDPKTGPEDLQIHTAQTAEQLMKLPVFVQASTSIRDAFRIMRENQLESIPLVDEEQQVIGELDLVELLLLWLRVLQAHPS